MHGAATCCIPRGQKTSVSSADWNYSHSADNADTHHTLLQHLNLIPRGLLMIMAGHSMPMIGHLLSDKLGQHIPYPHPAWVQQNQHENTFSNVH